MGLKHDKGMAMWEHILSRNDFKPRFRVYSLTDVNISSFMTKRASNYNCIKLVTVNLSSQSTPNDILTLRCGTCASRTF